MGPVPELFPLAFFDISGGVQSATEEVGGFDFACGLDLYAPHQLSAHIIQVDIIPDGLLCVFVHDAHDMAADYVHALFLKLFAARPGPDQLDWFEFRGQHDVVES